MSVATETRKSRRGGRRPAAQQPDATAEPVQPEQTPEPETPASQPEQPADPAEAAAQTEPEQPADPAPPRAGAAGGVRPRPRRCPPGDVLVGPDRSRRP